MPSDTTPGRRQQETRTFATTRRELESLGDWLACWGVTKIGMEATGDYWKPVFFLLESRGFDCVLYNAAQVKALPGRPKTDLLTELWDVTAGQSAVLHSASPLARCTAMRSRRSRALSQARSLPKADIRRGTNSSASPRRCFRAPCRPLRDAPKEP